MFGWKHFHYWFETKERNIEHWKSIIESMWFDFVIKQTEFYRRDKLRCNILPILTLIFGLVHQEHYDYSSEKVYCTLVVKKVTNTEQCMCDISRYYQYIYIIAQNICRSQYKWERWMETHFLETNLQIFPSILYIQNGLLIRLQDKLLTRLVIMRASCLLSFCIKG